MQEARVLISVAGASKAEQDRLSSELQQSLQTSVGSFTFARLKEDPESQDAGSILVAVLAAPAVVALAKAPAAELAKGIADWLRKRRVNVTIGADGGVKMENVPPDQLENAIAKILKSRDPK